MCTPVIDEPDLAHDSSSLRLAHNGH
jgi:hypothetical protein